MRLALFGKVGEAIAGADEVKSDKSLVDTCLGVQMQNFGVEFRDVNIGETKLCRMELIDH